MGKGDKKTKRGKIIQKSYGKSRLRKKRKEKMLNPIEKVLEKINNLDLSKYPKVELKNAITELGKVGIVIMTLHKGKSIMRLRPNKTEAEIFTQKSEVSFKPQKFNTTYQRASSPNNTMFYGCVVPEKPVQGEIENARITAILEASNFYRNNIKKGTEKLTFSRWIVTIQKGTGFNRR